MSEKLGVDSVYMQDETRRRGINTMGLFAVMSSIATTGAVIGNSGAWIFFLLVSCILIIWAFAEAIVHYLRFYSIVISILFCAASVYLNLP